MANYQLDPTNIPETLTKLAVPIGGLKHYGKNARKGNLGVIMESLETHGQYRPVVVRAGSNEILVGNHTVMAARELGWTRIVVTFVDVDDDQAARIVLVDKGGEPQWNGHSRLERSSSVLGVAERSGAHDQPATAGTPHEYRPLE